MNFTHGPKVRSRSLSGRWPVGTKQRLAFALLLYTGQRGSDVCRMTQTDGTGRLRVVQQKTGAKLVITVHRDLRNDLGRGADRPRHHSNDRLWAAFQREGLRPVRVRRHPIEAGLPPRCKAHGLRKAAARRLAEAGCSANEIMAVTGHKTLSEMERYVQRPNKNGSIGARLSDRRKAVATRKPVRKFRNEVG